MVRVTCLVTALVLAVCDLGCNRPAGPAKGVPGGVPFGGGALSPDDALGREWLQALNDYAEVLEKNGTGDQRRAASAKWQEKVRAIQELPRERQIAIREKFKDEIAATETRYKKAREVLDAKRPKGSGGAGK